MFLSAFERTTVINVRINVCIVVNNQSLLINKVLCIVYIFNKTLFIHPNAIHHLWLSLYSLAVRIHLSTLIPEISHHPFSRYLEIFFLGNFFWSSVTLISAYSVRKDVRLKFTKQFGFTNGP